MKNNSISEEWLKKFEEKGDELLNDFYEHYEGCLKEDSSITKYDATFGFFFEKIASLQLVVLEQQATINRLIDVVNHNARIKR